MNESRDLPCFFFDLTDGSGRHFDDVGTEFLDAERACAEAIALVSSVAADTRLSMDGTHELTATVRDEAGRPIYRAVLSVRGERISVQ
jgi:hypothetical protein